RRQVQTPAEVESCPGGDSDEQSGGSRRGDPARGQADRRRMGLPDRKAAGEADDPRGPSDVFNAPGNFLLLRAQPVGRKQRVEVRIRVVTQRRHELAQLVEPVATRGAIAQMLGGRRIKYVATPLRVVALVQTLVLEMRGANDHGCPPSSARSFRA